MSARDAVWTTVAATGLGSAVAATVAVWLLLTDPMAITTALDAHDLGALAETAAGALREIVVRLLL
jgi:hypothetical protein